MCGTENRFVEEIDYGTPAVKSDKTVTLTIDGRSVTVPEGTSIMRAARMAGIEVPKLCANDMVKSFGSCRLCLVEIEGKGGTPASCTTPVAEGISVNTGTGRLQSIRRGVMELYMSDHPEDCAACAAGDCEMVKMAETVGFKQNRFGQQGANHLTPAAKGEHGVNFKELDVSNPYFAYDPAKCIVCSLCVRACEEQQGTFALTVEGRGFESRITAGMDEPFLQSECVSCGACVQACPTGALYGYAHPQGPHPETDDSREDHRPVA